MADESTTFSTGTLQTFVAGAFIIALLALGMSIYNFSLTRSSVSALLDLQAAAVTANDGGEAEEASKAMAADMMKLEMRIKALEEAASAATAAATGSN